jgi:hypothetical protein
VDAERVFVTPGAGVTLTGAGTTDVRAAVVETIGCVRAGLATTAAPGALDAAVAKSAMLRMASRRLAEIVMAVLRGKERIAEGDVGAYIDPCQSPDLTIASP